MKDKKGLAEIIVGTMTPTDKKEASEDKEHETSEEEMSEDEVAASEVMEALKEDDVPAFTDALKSFIKICSYDKE